MHGADLFIEWILQEFSFIRRAELKIVRSESKAISSIRPAALVAEKVVSA
jgi:hypothetical protein